MDEHKMEAMSFKMDLTSVGALLSVAIVALAAFSLINIATYTLKAQKDIQSQGSISAEEGLYLDKGFIDWGTIEVGGEATENVTVTNALSAAVTLSLQTSNWDPANASDFMTLSWDYANQTLAKDVSLLINLTLSVSPEIEGITDFSFDIWIYSEEI